MTDFQINKARNFPLNRDGETITVKASEGDLVGLTENNGEPELVAADADSAVQQPAMGVVMEEVQDPANITVSGFETDYIEQRQLRREVREGDYTLVGDEATYIFDGVIVKNVDEDMDMTPNDPVYLDVGGGFTQVKPSGAGEIQQYVGVAVDANALLLDVDHEYATA